MRTLPPPWEQSLCTLRKTCAENSNPQGDSKGKQDLWESNQLLQSAFAAGLRQFLPIPCVKSVQCPGTASMGWAAPCRIFPLFPIITSQHPKSLWSLNQNQKQVDFLCHLRRHIFVLKSVILHLSGWAQGICVLQLLSVNFVSAKTEMRNKIMII